MWSRWCAPEYSVGTADRSSTITTRPNRNGSSRKACVSISSRTRTRSPLIIHCPTRTRHARIRPRNYRAGAYPCVRFIASSSGALWHGRPGLGFYLSMSGHRALFQVAGPARHLRASPPTASCWEPTAPILAPPPHRQAQRPATRAYRRVGAKVSLPRLRRFRAASVRKTSTGCSGSRGHGSRRPEPMAN